MGLFKKKERRPDAGELLAWSSWLEPAERMPEWAVSGEAGRDQMLLEFYDYNLPLYRAASHYAAILTFRFLREPISPVARPDRSEGEATLQRMLTRARLALIMAFMSEMSDDATKKRLMVNVSIVHLWADPRDEAHAPALFDHVLSDPDDLDGRGYRLRALSKWVVGPLGDGIVLSEELEAILSADGADPGDVLAPARAIETALVDELGPTLANDLIRSYGPDGDHYLAMAIKESEAEMNDLRLELTPAR